MRFDVSVPSSSEQAAEEENAIYICVAFKLVLVYVIGIVFSVNSVVSPPVISPAPKRMISPFVLLSTTTHALKLSLPFGRYLYLNLTHAGREVNGCP